LPIDRGYGGFDVCMDGSPVRKAAVSSMARIDVMPGKKAF
jgi:hypothetical protein